MRLKSIHIKNFRLIENLRVDLAPQTAILGGNGCGKSTLLRAMERFFGHQTSMEADDFFGKDLTRTIEIELTFQDFNDTELELFDSRIHHNEMTVARIFEAAGGRRNGKYYGSTLKHIGFDVIRAIDGANEKKTAYSQLRTQDALYTPLPIVQRADQISPALENWERDHRDQCELGRDDGQFFGFTNVAKGALQKATSFVFVPAVRDVSADAVDAKGAVIARLMELVVRSAIQKRQNIRDFQARISEEFRAITDPAQLPELNSLAENLSQTLQVFYNEAGVSLEWRAVEEFNIPLPAADVFLNDDGFKGPVDHKGHGLQRAFVVTLLQHLSRASSLATNQAEGEVIRAAAADGEHDGEPLPQDAHADPVPMPGLILAIEEPELYQHPTKQRHFARVLSELSSGRIPGVATSTQVIFASHSPLFVSLDRFDEIRIARRSESVEGNLRTCVMRSAALDRIVQQLERIHAKPAGTFNADSLRARLHILGAELAEGFFANLVVLVEGVSDRAAVLATARTVDVDLEALGISVLSAGGKSNLDRLALIFNEFGIPVYLVWDCDSSKTKADELADAAAMNRTLQRLCRVAEQDQADFLSVVGERHTCFHDNLESVMLSEIGGEAFLRLLDPVKGAYGIVENKHAMKIPNVVTEVLRRAASEGLRSQTLQDTVTAILRLKAHPEMIEV